MGTTRKITCKPLKRHSISSDSILKSEVWIKGKTLSKAFDRSQTTIQQCFPSSILLTILWYVSNDWKTVEWPGKKTSLIFVKQTVFMKRNFIMFKYNVLFFPWVY